MLDDARRLNSMSRELLPYVMSIHECTKAEAELMIKATFTAMVHKFLNESIVNTPLGRICFVPRNKMLNPLRVVMRAPLNLVQFLNTGKSETPLAIKDTMGSEQYEALSEFIYASKHKKEQMQNDSI